MSQVPGAPDPQPSLAELLKVGVTSTDASTSWDEAVHAYALAAHRNGDLAACTEWSFRLAAKAANDGPANRASLRGEDKCYIDIWDLTAAEERTQHDCLVHLIEEHDLPHWQKLDLAGLLSDSYWFDERYADTVRTTLAGRVLTLDDLLPATPNALPSASRSTPLNSAHAWAITDWVVVEAIPTAIAFAGLHERAAEFRSLAASKQPGPRPPVPRGLAELSLMTPDAWAELARPSWTDRMEAFGGWDDLFPVAGVDDEDESDSPDSTDRLDRFDDCATEITAQTLATAGLGPHASSFSSGQHSSDDYVSTDFFDTNWRLLRAHRPG